MNKELLIENLEKKGNIILYFNSQKCGSCKQAKPIVKKIVESKNNIFILMLLKVTLIPKH
jgi:thioredoxin-like negative regulator of GroEL